MEERNVCRELVVVSMLCVLSASAGTQFAKADTIQKWLIMPGPVVAGHADTEADCDSCHAPLSDVRQGELCIACHTEVGADVTGEAGFHGRLPASERFECAGCHTEHEGRDARIVLLDEATFDHTMTDFALRGAHAEVSCEACHAAGEPHRDADTTCVGCHREQDPHRGRLGDACESCHTESDWSETTFDHAVTGFLLTGAHAGTSCAACHRSDDLADVGRTCVACHRQDDVHEGRNGTDCGSCHRTSGWNAVTFDHHAMTGFALAGGHDGLGCGDCHRARDFRDLGGAQCSSCHLDDDVHEGGNGTDCTSCHTVADWATIEFDHGRKTGFELPPGHTDLACSSCHTADIREALPRDCGGCHAADDPHEGQLGDQCDGCHVASGWTTTLWFDHGITSFPLLGAHADVGCDGCHDSAAFHDTQDYCVACHGADDAHRGALGNQCDDCHNPVDWRAWQFDHDEQTAFALMGAHRGLECAACHAASRRQDASVSKNCSSCHRRDDPHRGRFGTNCGGCHNTSTFSQLEGM